MRLIVFVVLLTFGSGILDAQTIPAPTTYSRPDTIRAVRHLFAAKRTGSKIYLGIGLPLVLTGAMSAFLATTVVTTIKGGQGKENAVPIILVSGGIGVVPGSIGLVRGIRFSRKRERAILSAYQDGLPLPRRILRRLKPRYFQ